MFVIVIVLTVNEGWLIVFGETSGVRRVESLEKWWEGVGGRERIYVDKIKHGGIGRKKVEKIMKNTIGASEMERPYFAHAQNNHWVMLRLKNV